MALEAKIVTQLIATFKTELDEKLHIITDGLLALEKNTKKKRGISKKTIEEIFRAAHNIKGAAHSVGVTHVGEIAHQIESLFTAIRDKVIPITPDIITLCLSCVDAMHSAMQSFCDNKPLAFDLNDLLARLQQGKPGGKEVVQEAIALNIEPLHVSPQVNEYETIRVSLSQINHVGALVEQMQINKIAIEDHYSALIALSEKSKQLSRLHSVSKEQITELSYLMHQLRKFTHNSVKELDTIANALQDEIRMLRLVPASSLLRHLMRSARDLAHELGKHIAFEIIGDTVKLDKLILEGLKDPLIHLLRNAIDHGIESSLLRKQSGKSEIGNIRLEIMEEGGEIVITIKDDGVGMDCKMIAQSALNKGIITQSELDSMSEVSILELIFRPEISTKKIITDISGRGVGLDVVKSNVADLKGQVTCTTQLGEGSTFYLRVPLTLSSDIGLTIKSGGQLFVIPVRAIEHVMMIPIDAIHEVEASQIILFEEKPIPLSTLSDLLNLEKTQWSAHAKFPIVLLKKGWNRVALLVDEIIGEREIVIKPLQPPLVTVSCVAGGTLSGTGEVIIVLNPGDIMHQALYGGKRNRINLDAVGLETTPRHHILLVDDSITTRTLEKNILESNDYQVSVAVDGQQAWDLLQEHTFSLVISDIEMPNMDGFELTQRIKNSTTLQDLPVIIVTSLGNEEQKRRGIEVGANAYIVKQYFESTELLEIVGQLV